MLGLEEERAAPELMEVVTVMVTTQGAEGVVAETCFETAPGTPGGTTSHCFERLREVLLAIAIHPLDLPT